MPTDWEDVLLAYLHDPPDKPLALAGHVVRAARYAAAVLWRPVADSVLSVAERLPAPVWRV